MATDPNKKTLRHFQCRDYLWETFEQMSAELECSVDYLINEAMRQYARSRSYGNRIQGQGAPSGRDSDMDVGSALNAPAVTPATGSAPPTGMNSPMQRSATGTGVPSRAPSIPGMAAGRPPGIPAIPPSAAPAPRLPSLAASTLPQARAPATPAAPMGRPPGQSLPPMNRPPTAPSMARPSAAPPPFPGGAPSQPRMPPMPPLNTVPPAAPSVAPPPMQRPMPSMQPQSMDAQPQMGQGTPVLTAVYQGERYPVTKEEFVIGRGQKTSDLVIRDSNVSRRHAVVVLHNGQYWMVDQQSTNGVEYMGAKIDRKRIDEGDVFKICDYEVLFTYR